MYIRTNPFNTGKNGFNTTLFFNIDDGLEHFGKFSPEIFYNQLVLI